MTKRIDIVCSDCGSRNVMRDAWARWNTSAQCWELGDVFDQGYCEDCDGEATLKEIPLAETAKRARRRRPSIAKSLPKGTYILDGKIVTDGNR